MKLLNILQIKRIIPKKTRFSNKSTNGKLLTVAGSPGMWGAAKLCTLAAYKTGCGYVVLALPQRPSWIKKAFQTLNPEVLSCVFPIKTLPKQTTAILIGPGSGARIEILKFIKTCILSSTRIPILLDADALTLVAKNNLYNLPSHFVLTPHTGEMSKLIERSSAWINKNRLVALMTAIKKYRCHIVLKGDRTLIGTPTGEVFCNPTGNYGLAKAGTGDVLAGIIGGFLAQGLSSLHACQAGVYLHGTLADEWKKRGNSPLALMASDLIDLLPSVLKKVERPKK